MSSTTKIKPFSVSHSKMAEFRRCKQRFHWKYVDKFYPRSSMGQARGTAGHSFLAEWHTSYDRDKAVTAAWNKWSGEGYPDNPDWQILYASLQRYADWSKENDTFKIVETEKKFEIEYSVEGFEDRPIVFVGYIDGIVEEKGKLWLLENKFYKVMQTNGLEMDQQVSLYLLASHLMDYDVQGVIYNMVRVADTKVAVTEPVVRKRMFRNPDGLEKIQSEMLLQVQDMLKYHYEGGQPYRNPTKDCSWDCPFYQPCLSMQDNGQESKEFLLTISNVRKDEEQDATN